MSIEMEIDHSAVLNELSETESELYDRQIRLWGLESQKRLRAAKILIAGLNGLGAEVAKNLILAGVQAVTLLDDQVVTQDDFCSQFLVNELCLGKNRAEASVPFAQSLNPMVKIAVDMEPLPKKDAAYFECFDVVVICGATNTELQRISDLCREKVNFFAGDVWGTFGYEFADLGTHEFIEDTVKYKVTTDTDENVKSEPVTSVVKRTLNYLPYSALVEFNVNKYSYQRRLKRVGPALAVLKVLQKFRMTFGRDPSRTTRDDDITTLKKLCKECSYDFITDAYFDNIFNQISATVAVVGGVLAQEIIKVVSKKEAPHRNVFLFDPQLSSGFIEQLDAY